MGLASSTPKERKPSKRYFDDRYEITAIIGRGSRSVVYSAKRRIVSGSSIAADTEVAVKVLLGDAHNQATKERLRTEGLIVRSCENPGVIRLLDFRASDSFCYLVFEYARLGDLAVYAKNQGGRIAPSQAELFLRQCLGALNTIHHRKILHRDIKPSNLLVTSPQEIKIGDFGIAALPGDTATGSDVVSAIATISYTSPEVLQDLPCSPLSDIYSLALSIYEMATGVYPFSADPSSINLRREAVLPPPAQLVPGLSKEFSDTILALLNPDPSQRPQSAAEALDLLDGRGLPARKAVEIAPSGGSGSEEAELAAIEPHATPTEQQTEELKEKPLKPRVVNTEELPDSGDDFVVDAAPFRVEEGPLATSKHTSETVTPTPHRTLSDREIAVARSDTAYVPASALEEIRKEAKHLASSPKETGSTVRDEAPRSTPSESQYNGGWEKTSPEVASSQHVESQDEEEPATPQQQQHAEDSYDEEDNISEPTTSTYNDSYVGEDSYDDEDDAFNNEESESEAYQTFDNESAAAEELSTSSEQQDLEDFDDWISRRGRGTSEANGAPQDEEHEGVSHYETPSRSKQNRVLKTLLLIGLILPILYSVLPELSFVRGFIPAPVSQWLGLSSPSPETPAVTTPPSASQKPSDSGSVTPPVDKGDARERQGAGSLEKQAALSPEERPFGAPEERPFGAPEERPFGGAAAPKGLVASDGLTDTQSPPKSTSPAASAVDLAIPRYNGEPLTFPVLPAGVFKGTVINASVKEKAPLTLISLPSKGHVIVSIGLEGWQPVVVDITEMKEDLKVPMSGHVFVFSLDKTVNKNFLKGAVIDQTTGTRGRWEVTPAQ